MAQTPPTHGVLSRFVRRAASGSARRPKTMIALWLLLVVGCVTAGAMTGTKELSGPDAAVRLQQAGGGSLDKAFDEIIEEDLQSAELISLPIILVVLVIAFGAIVAALVPLLLGVTAVAAAMGAAGVLSQIAPDSGNTASLIVLI